MELPSQLLPVLVRRFTGLTWPSSSSCRRTRSPTTSVLCILQTSYGGKSCVVHPAHCSCIYSLCHVFEFTNLTPASTSKVHVLPGKYLRCRCCRCMTALVCRFGSRLRFAHKDMLLAAHIAEAACPRDGMWAPHAPHLQHGSSPWMLCQDLYFGVSWPEDWLQAALSRHHLEGLLSHSMLHIAETRFPVATCLARAGSSASSAPAPGEAARMHMPCQFVHLQAASRLTVLQEA